MKPKDAPSIFMWQSSLDVGIFGQRSLIVVKN